MISYVCDRCERSFEKPASLHKVDVDGVKADLCAFCTQLAKQALGALIAEGKAKAEASREQGRGIVRALRLQAQTATAELDELKAAIAAAAPAELEQAPVDDQAQPEPEQVPVDDQAQPELEQQPVEPEPVPEQQPLEGV